MSFLGNSFRKMQDLRKKVISVASAPVKMAGRAIKQGAQDVKRVIVKAKPALESMRNVQGIVQSGGNPITSVFTVPTLQKKAANVVKEIGQATARSIGSAGLTGLNKLRTTVKEGTPLAKLIGKEPQRELSYQNQTGVRKVVHETVFGKHSVRDLPTRARQAEETLNKYGLNKRLSKATAMPIVAGLTALDFTGFGGEGKAGLKAGREAFEFALKKAGTIEDAIKVLGRAKVPKDLIEIFAPRFAKETDLKIIKEGVDALQDALSTTKKVGQEAAETLPTALGKDALERKLTNLRELADANPFDEAVAVELKRTEEALTQTAKGAVKEVDPAVEAVQKNLDAPKRMMGKKPSVSTEASEQFKYWDDVANKREAELPFEQVQKDTAYLEAVEQRAKAFESTIDDLEIRLSQKYGEDTKSLLENAGATKHSMAGIDDILTPTETKIQSVYNHFADKVDKPNIRGLTFGKNSDRPFAGMTFEGKVDEQVLKKTKKFFLDLEDAVGTPDQSRTGIMNLEGSSPIPLNDRGIESVSSPVAYVQKQLNDVKRFSSRTAKVPEEAFPARTPSLPPETPRLPQEAMPPRTDIVPQVNEGLSLEGSISQVGGEVKQRGFIESVLESPNISEETKKLVEQLPDDKLYYDVFTDKAAVERAQSLIQESQDKALSYVLNATEVDKDVVTTGIELMRQYRQAGNFVMEAEVAGNLAEKGTKLGQGVQAYSILGKLSPEGVLVYAAKRLREGVPTESFTKLDTATKEVVDKFSVIEKEIGEQVAKGADQMKLFGDQKPGVLDDIAKTNKDAAERLANKIKIEEKTKQPDAVSDMVATLHKVAQELLPAKGKKVPRNQIDLIGEAINERQVYREVWDKAQTLVKQKYAGNEQALELLDDYFNTFLETPFSKKQLEKAVNQGMKADETNLAKVVREHFSVVKEKRTSLVDRLVNEANISPEQAVKLSDQIRSRFDELVKAKKESILNAIFKERNIVDKTVIDRIIELSNLGGFESSKFRPLIAKKLDIPELSEQLSKKLVAQAEKIQALPIGQDRIKAIHELNEIFARETPKTVGRKVYDWALEILGSFKTMKSSFFDLSFGLRQGKLAAYRHPKEWFKAWKTQFPAFKSEKGYDQLMDMLIKDPDFSFANQAGVAFTDVNAPLLFREEGYAYSKLLEKIPGYGRVIRATNRAYTIMGNKLRMNIFSTLIKNAERMGKNPRGDIAIAKKIAMHINNMTGRGALPGKHLQEASGLLNAIFFSPRLTMSRINMLVPWEYAKADPMIRKEWLKTMLAFGAGTTTILGLAELAGADIGTDMRSADFAKIKIGNTRVDITGGFQQYFRMAAQLYTGKYVSSSTGKIVTLGEGYKSLSRFDILFRQAEGKEAPLFAFISHILKQQDATGEKVKMTDELLNLITPIMASDMWDLYKDDASLFEMIGFSAASFLGEGLQTYAQPEAYVKMNEIRTAADPGKAYQALKKENPKLAQKVDRAGTESTFTEFDWSLTYMGVENGERAQFLYNQFKGMKSDAERTALWKELKQKKLLSKNVQEQLDWLYKHPDYQASK